MSLSTLYTVLLDKLGENAASPPISNISAPYDLGSTADVFVHADCMSKDAVSYLGPRNTGADLDDFASNVGAEHEGILDVVEHCISNDLLGPINRVDRRGTIPDDYLFATRASERCRLDLEWPDGLFHKVSYDYQA